MEGIPRGHGRTWFIDLDGTVFEHNKYLKHPGKLDVPLPHAKEFLKCIPKHDTIIFTTGRVEGQRKTIIASLKKAHLRFDQIVTGLPNGARILINDEKLVHNKKTALAITVSRNGRTGSVHQTLSKKLYAAIEKDDQLDNFRNRPKG